MFQKLNRRDFSILLGVQLLIMLFITPLPLLGRHTLNNWINVIFESPINWMKPLLFRQVENYSALITDSQNYMCLLIIGFLFGIVCWRFLMRFFMDRKFQTYQFIRIAIIYYISWIFMAYGFSKLQMIQFPPIDQVTAQSRIGEMDLDILFWTTMGASKLINIIFGSIEVLAALLLLFQKTRSIGLLLSLVIASQILVFNLSFDISVKYFASLLWLSLFYLSFNTTFSIVKTLVYQQPEMFEKRITLETNSVLKSPIKIVIVGGIIVSSVFG